MNLGVVYFGSIRGLGGWEVFLHNLLERLVVRGHTVHAYTQPRTPAALRAEALGRSYAIHGILPRRLAGKGSPVLRGILRGAAMARGHELWQVVGAYPAGYVAAGLGRPVVLRTHGKDIQIAPDLDYGMRLRPKHARRIQAAVLAADRVVALTRTVTECYQELGVPPERVVEIPNGVDLARFERPSGPAPATVRREMGVPPDGILLLTVGRYHPKKGFDLIPDAAAILRRRGLTFHWAVVGEGTEGLRPAVARRDLEDRVLLRPGIRPDTGSSEVPPDALIAVYRAADLFVFPSLLETFGRVLIEAMAAGTPIVTTDAPGCRDVVAHERNGLAARAGDAESLADQVERVLTDTSLARALAVRAVRDVERYDWERVVDAYEALYRELLG